jgi:hypothetical protein
VGNAHDTPPRAYSDGKVANRDERGFGWEVARAVVTRRPPISLYAMVARTGGNTYAVGVWDLSTVQGAFSVAPCQTIATFASLYVTPTQPFLSLEERGCMHARAVCAIQNVAHAPRLSLSLFLPFSSQRRGAAGLATRMHLTFRGAPVTTDPSRGLMGVQPFVNAGDRRACVAGACVAFVLRAASARLGLQIPSPR